MMTVKKILEAISEIPESQRDKTLVYFESDSVGTSSLTLMLKSPRRNAYLAKSLVFVMDPELRRNQNDSR